MKRVESDTKLKIIIDLNKSTGKKGSLDTSKLVKKPVQVKGKDGKTFTRMQWVKPFEAEPVDTTSSNVEPDTSPKTPKKEIPDPHLIVGDDSDFIRDTNIESGKNTTGTLKEFVDKLSKKMSREEKYNTIDKHNITWEESDNDMINHMRAVVALKEYMVENPEKFGADHLPTESAYEKTPTGEDIINVFYDKVKKKSNLYKMMQEAGIGTGTDPRESGDPADNIKHMHNVRAYKKYLAKNKEVMDDPRWEISKKMNLPKDKKKQSKAQKGGNTIEGVLGNMSEEDKFAYIKKLGISDEDLTTVDKVTRRKLLNQLKIKVVLDPSILNTDPHEDKEDKGEVERVENLDDVETTKEDVNKFFRTILNSTKDMLLDEYKDVPMMANRVRNANEKIDRMHGLATLKKHFMENPNLLEDHKGDLEDDELSQLKITNKQMEKVLRKVAGIRGSYDVRIIERDEDIKRTIEWEFLDDSFARIERDENGEWVLNVAHFDYDLQDYEDKVFSLSEVRDHVQGLTGRGVPKEKEIPLHMKSMAAIQKALNENIEQNYTEEIGKVMSPWILRIWSEKANRDTSVSTIASQEIINADTLERVLNKMGIDTQFGFIQYNDNWNKAIYSHLIEDTKTKDAIDYLVYNNPDEADTYLLHESAKRWTPEERDEARMDLVNHMAITPRAEDRFDRPTRYKNHLKQALSFIPFDLFSDIVANGTKIAMRGITTHQELDSNGNIVEYDQEFLGGHFNAGKNRIEISQRYFYDNSVLADTAMGNNPGATEEGYIMHPLGHIIAHEMGHCIDNFLSSGNKSGNSYLDWSGDVGRKYVGKEYSETNPVSVSYDQTVESSNPGKRLGVVKDSTGEVLYVYHKGNWIDSYEGRVYNIGYEQLNSSVVAKAPDGSLIDKNYDSGNQKMRGIEHWSHSVARFADARMAYKDEESFDTFKDWCIESSTRLDEQGVTSYSQAADTDLMASYAKEYLVMEKNFPHMAKAIEEIFDRGDFKGEKSPSYTEQLNNSHPHDKVIVRKSNESLIINI